MCRILAIEDDEANIDRLQTLIAGHPAWATLQFECCGAQVAEERVSRAPHVDILVVPINAGGVHEGGIDLVRKLDADHTLPLVIYTCTREAYTSAVYSTRHQYLLLTPFSPVEVRAALDKVLGMIGRVAAPVMLRSGGSTHVINPHEVQFVQSQGRKVLVSYVDGRELYAYAALSDLEKQLPGSFVRCHKSYLANMEHVIRGCREALTMTTGAQVPVSQRQYRAVRDALAPPPADKSSSFPRLPHHFDLLVSACGTVCCNRLLFIVSSIVKGSLATFGPRILLAQNPRRGWVRWLACATMFG